MINLSDTEKESYTKIAWDELIFSGLLDIGIKGLHDFIFPNFIYDIVKTLNDNYIIYKDYLKYKQLLYTHKKLRGCHNIIYRLNIETMLFICDDCGSYSAYDKKLVQIHKFKDTYLQ